MFRASKLFLSSLIFLFCLSASAQDLQILFPQEGQKVRGQMTVRYSGIPEGGYAVIKLDGNFYTATSLSTFVLNTFPPMFAGDGKHSLTITSINEGGKKLSEKKVNFEISNNSIEAGAESISLTHFADANRTNPNVDRYRIFAESNAIVEFPKAAEGASGVGGAGGGAMGEAGADGVVKEKPRWMRTPLDWQVGGLMRRIVRDVGMYSDDKGEGFSSANIATSVQGTSQHQRDEANILGASPTERAPWKSDWESGAETGKLVIENLEASGQMVGAIILDDKGKPTGEIISPNLKPLPPTLVVFLPSFPESPVSPGSTWETNMTFLSELSAREPIRVKAPITFTTFESITTPAGSKRRVAKLESRFRLTPDLASTLANTLFTQASAAPVAVEGDEAAAPVEAAAPAEGEVAAEPVFGPISTTYSRIFWFDFESHRVLRSEDKAHVEFRMTDAPVESISYDLTVVTWFDDTVPASTSKYTGAGGPRGSNPKNGGRDKYNKGNPTLEKAIKP